MVFFHKMRQGRVVITPSAFQFLQVAGEDGVRRVPKWGKTVEWRPLKSEEGITFGGKTWRGKVTINDPELISILMAHKNYKIDFIAISGDGSEVFPEDAFFVDKGDYILCAACDKPFESTQGVAGHKTSAAHKENVRKYVNKASEAMELRGV